MDLSALGDKNYAKFLNRMDLELTKIDISLGNERVNHARYASSS